MRPIPKREPFEHLRVGRTPAAGSRIGQQGIASRLNVSESVVKNTIQQLFAKTEVRTRSQLVRVALECYRDLL